MKWYHRLKSHRINWWYVNRQFGCRFAQVELDPCHYPCKRRIMFLIKVVIGVMPTTMAQMPKLAYKSFWRIIRKLRILEYLCENTFLGQYYVLGLSLISVYIYSFMVPSHWSLNCSFSAIFVTPQGSWIWVLMRLQRSASGGARSLSLPLQT